MKRTALFVLIALACAGTARAGDYMPKTPGTVRSLAGQITVGDAVKPVSRTLRVLPPDAVTGAPPAAVILHVTTSADGKTEDAVACLERRSDGYYLIGTAKAPGKKCALLKTPALELPIPLEQGVTWTTVRDEKGTLRMAWTVVGIDPATKVAHVLGKGTAKALGMEFPVEREYWVSPDGEKSKEIIRQTVLGTESVTTLEPVAEQ